MTPLFPLAPRYRLDDELPWLEGIDPSRHYWVRVNGDAAQLVAIPGLAPATFEEFKTMMLRFRALRAGEAIELKRASSACRILCVSQNCFAIEAEIEGAKVWHLFDQEALDSLLMTAHPDWRCSPKDEDLGRQLLMRSWKQAIAA